MNRIGNEKESKEGFFYSRHVALISVYPASRAFQ